MRRVRLVNKNITFRRKKHKLYYFSLKLPPNPEFTPGIAPDELFSLIGILRGAFFLRGRKRCEKLGYPLRSISSMGFRSTGDPLAGREGYDIERQGFRPAHEHRHPLRSR